MTVVVESKWTELFYDLPIENLAVGVSTGTGQDVILVDTTYDPEWVRYECYTPNSNPAIDQKNRRFSQTGYAPRGRMTTLCVYSDTCVDLSRHPKATNCHVRDADTGQTTPISREEWLAIQNSNGHHCQ